LSFIYCSCPPRVLPSFPTRRSSDLGLPLVGPRGGPLFGMLKTVDGGASWNEIGRNVFQGKFVARILPANVKTNQGDLVLAATLEGGLHISPDGGATWDLSKAVNAPVTDVAADPARP